MRLPRASGVLLHPTSLPGRHGIGGLGPEAYSFLEFLAATGQRWWQMLPLGPTGFGNSPYQSHSSFAGNALLIDLDDLVRRGWLAAEACPVDSQLLGGQGRFRCRGSSQGSSSAARPPGMDASAATTRSSMNSPPAIKSGWTITPSTTP